MKSLENYNYFHVYRPSLNGNRFIDWCTEEYFISTYFNPVYLQNDDNNFFVCDTREMFEVYPKYKELYPDKQEKLLVKCITWAKESKRWEEGIEHIIYLSGEKELDELIERSKALKTIVIGVIIPVSKLRTLDMFLDDDLLNDMKANKESLTDDYLNHLKKSIKYDWVERKFKYK